MIKPDNHGLDNDVRVRFYEPEFWGWGPNQDGRNELGKLWMEIRAELRR